MLKGTSYSSDKWLGNPCMCVSCMNGSEMCTCVYMYTSGACTHMYVVYTVCLCVHVMWNVCIHVYIYKCVCTNVKYMCIVYDVFELSACVHVCVTCTIDMHVC